MTNKLLFPTIHAAAQAGDVKEVKRFLKSNKALLNQVDEQGETPLLLAAREGHTSLVQYLLTYRRRPFFLGDKRLKMNAVTMVPGRQANDKTALIWAIERGHYDVVRLLLDSGAMEESNSPYAFPFWIAASSGRVDIVELLLKRDTTLLNQRDKNGQTALLWAASHGHSLVVSYLLAQKGIDLNAVTNSSDGANGRTALLWAARNGYYYVVEMLLDAGARTYGRGFVTCLHLAAGSGHVKLVALLLKRVPNLLNATYSNGQTALHFAIEQGHCEVVKMLLDAGAEYKPSDDMNLDLIHLAAQGGHVETVKLFLEKDSTKLNKTDAHGQTPLLWAAFKGHSEVVHYLLTQKEIHLNAATNSSEAGNGWTALLWAASKGHCDVVDMLLDAGAKTSGESDSCLHSAAGSGHVNMVEHLLKRVPQLLNATDSDGQTALHVAIKQGRCEVVKVLLDAGAKYKPIDEMNFDLIHLAARAGHVEMVKLLLERDPTGLNKTDAKGQTALIWAAIKGHNEVVRYLLTQEGIRLNESTCSSDVANGSTALHWAISSGHYSVVKMLLDAGARTDGEDFSCFHLAAEAGHVKIVELLLKRVPNLLNETNADGKTVLQVAIEGGHCEMVKMLLDAGAEYKPIGDMNFDLIHLAARAGHVEMVKLLLERDPTRLNKTDAKGQTALLWAASKGRSEVVRYLLTQEGVDLLASTQDPGKSGHGRTAFQWAIAGAHPVEASLLYHANPDESHKQAILNLIKNATMALELMIADSRNKALMEGNPFITDLLKASDQPFRYYTAIGRRPSCYIEIDKQSGEARIFQKGKKLGAGGFGDVVDFVSENNEHRVVKYHKEIWIDAMLRQQNRIEESKKEQAFREKAYPGRNVLFEFERTHKGKKQYSLRDVSDFVAGKTLENFFPTVTSVAEIVNFFLLITQEMMMLHDKGILHRDCKRDNIMVTDDHRIRFIDFGESHWLSEEGKGRYDGEAGLHSNIAPEFYGTSRIRFDVTQDIYALGRLFLRLLERHSKKSRGLSSLSFDRSVHQKCNGYPAGKEACAGGFSCSVNGRIAVV